MEFRDRTKLTDLLQQPSGDRTTSLPTLLKLRRKVGPRASTALHGFDKQLRRWLLCPEQPGGVQSGSAYRRKRDSGPKDRRRHPMRPLDNHEPAAEQFVPMWHEEVESLISQAAHMQPVMPARLNAG
ncbi:hypothetical protein [Prauserella flavalba]|uniref:hypothetical protein n=1 Tax=Prauserella flavalba TaxID=1477506 RepID=UPI0036EBFFD3